MEAECTSDRNRRYPPTLYSETGTQSQVQHECGSRCFYYWRLNVHRENHESARCSTSRSTGFRSIPCPSQDLHLQKIEKPRRELSDTQPATSLQSSSEPSSDPLNAGPSTRKPAPTTSGGISDSKPSELPSPSTLDFLPLERRPVRRRLPKLNRA